MEVILPVVFAYLFILIGFRVIGKRDLGSLSPFDLVVLMIIPEIFSQALNRGDASLLNATIGGATIFGLLYATSAISAKSRTIQKFIEGEPTVLMRHGRTRPEALRRERVSEEEILAEARKDGVDRIEDIECAILENDGQISIIAKERQRRAQANAAF